MPGPPADPAPSPDELLAVALLAAEGAAELLLAGLARDRRVVGTKTSATDLVTEVDEAAERHVVATILGARPHDAVVGEEGTDRPGTSGVAWVIDPIDGTTNYLYGHPGFAVSVAATVGGRSVAGVVVDPVAGDTFTATLGGGAHRNGLAVRCSSQADLGHALVATGFGYDPERRRRQAEVLVSVLPAVRDLRRVGAASLDLCSVACGRVDAYYEWGLKPWDHAAGALVATEAGASVGDGRGGPPSSELTLAAAPPLFEPLRALLAAGHAPGGGRDEAP